jgi:hypothetical protein
MGFLLNRSPSRNLIRPISVIKVNALSSASLIIGRIHKQNSTYKLGPLLKGDGFISDRSINFTVFDFFI